MPGGRVQPVILVKPVDAQKQKQLDDARKAQLEETRQRTIAAQQALREEQERIAADRLILEKKLRDEELLRLAHEAKLAEGSSATDMTSQKDADEELKQWQMAGLKAESQKGKADVEVSAQHVSDLINTDAELAAIRSRINSILNDDMSGAQVV